MNNTKLKNKVRNTLSKYSEELINEQGENLIGLYEERFLKIIDEIYEEKNIDIPKELVMNAILSLQRYKINENYFVGYSDLEEVFTAFINENKKYFENFKTPKIVYSKWKVFENYKDFEKNNEPVYNGELGNTDIINFINKETKDDNTLLITLSMDEFTVTNLMRINEENKDYYVIYDIILNKSISKKTIRVEGVSLDETLESIKVKEVAFLKSEHPELIKIAYKFYGNSFYIKVIDNDDLINKINSCYDEDVNIILELR